MSGVWSEPKAATVETQEIADKVSHPRDNIYIMQEVDTPYKICCMENSVIIIQVKEEALKKLKQEAFIEYKTTEYQTQVVAGVNFKIKVQSM